MSHITESRRGTVYCQGMCSVTCNGLQRSVGAPHSESVASAHLVSILNSLVHRAVPVELSTVRRSAVTPCPSTELRGAARRWRLGDRTVDDDVVSRLSAVPIYSILARQAPRVWCVRPATWLPCLPTQRQQQHIHEHIKSKLIKIPRPWQPNTERIGAPDPRASTRAR